MWKKEAGRNFGVFFKAGLPYTILGIMIIFAGIYALKRIFAGSEYLAAILFVWLALFWMIYQSMFRKRISEVAGQGGSNGDV